MQFITQFQFVSNQQMNNMNSSPRRTCVKRDILKLEGISFSQWINEPNNIYIDKNAAKYSKKQGLSDSIWYKDIKELQKFKSGNEDEDYFTVYEQCIRAIPEMWDNLDKLENKVLGCWCKASQQCHGDILIKLYEEKKRHNLYKEHSAQFNDEDLSNYKKY